LSIQDVQRPTTDDILPPGARVGEFEIQRWVGAGGFGIVYLAYDHSLMRSVAVKEYLPASLAQRAGDNTIAVRSEQDRNTFEAGLHSFINEARLLAQFDHPALIRVFRFWEENQTAYMATPFYEGETLRTLVRREPEIINESWIRALLSPLLNALETLHRGNVFYRDISPDNIVIQKNGAPVLVDFGAARFIADDRGGKVAAIVKPGYAPVEQYSEELASRQGPWSDVYAVCAMLHYMITGKAPPAAATRAISDNYVPLHRRRELMGYTRDFLRAIDFGLTVHAEDRPQSIAELRELLNWRPEMYATTAAAASPPGATVAPEAPFPRGAHTVPQPHATRPKATASEPAPPLILELGPMPTPDDNDNGGGGFVFPPPSVGAELSAAHAVTPRRAGNGGKWVAVLGLAAVLLSVFYLGPALSPSISQDIPAGAPASGRAVPADSAVPSFAQARPATDQRNEPVPVAPHDGIGNREAAPSTAQSAGQVTTAAPALPDEPAATHAENPRGAADTSSAAGDRAAQPPAQNSVAATSDSAAEPRPKRHRRAAPHGYLLLDIRPAGYVSVDGTVRGTSPPVTRLELSPGTHSISINNGSSQPLETKLDITDGGSVLLSHSFER